MRRKIKIFSETPKFFEIALIVCIGRKGRGKKGISFSFQLR